jgi:PmbA protein
MLMDKISLQADIVLSSAKKLGIDECEFFATSSEGVNVSTRLGKLEKLETSQEHNYAISIVKNKKKGFISFSHFEEKQIEKKLNTALDLAKSSIMDEFIGLSDKKLFANSIEDIDMFDATDVGAQTLIDDCLAMEEIGLKQDRISNSDGAGAGGNKYIKFYANSAGFAKGYRGSNFSKSVTLIAGKDLDMQYDYDYSQVRHYKDLDNNKKLALEASMKAIGKLNPQKLQSQKIDVVLDRRVSSQLLGNFLELISGDMVVLGSSVLKDKLGSYVFSKKVTIVDDPSIKRAIRSIPFDGEGVRVSKKKIVENGMLNSWLLNSYYARKLGMESTGNCSVGASASRGISCWNFFMENGELNKTDMLSGKKTMLITDIFGPNVNYLTGDFSAGFSGFYYEKGKLVSAINEMTFAGNLLDIFSSLEVGDDLERVKGVDAPSIFVPSLTIAGV